MHARLINAVSRSEKGKGCVRKREARCCMAAPDAPISPIKHVWFGTAFLGGSKRVIKFFSTCHTNGELRFRLDFDVVLVDIAILGRCQALVIDCSYAIARERSGDMADQKWHLQCIILL